MAKHRRPTAPTSMRVVTPPPRAPGRRGQRLESRLRDASGNVATAMGGAAGRGPLALPLQEAADQWTAEAERVRRDLAVTHELTGDAHKQALRKLAARVDDLERVAARIVDTAFLSTLVPATPDDDPLHHASERIDALEEAYAELAALDRPDATWRVTAVRWRALVPPRRRRPAS